MSMWSSLPRPFFALAPMSGFTDSAFRTLVSRHGKPDLMVTEFVTTAGLCSLGRENLRRELRFEACERPLVIQFFGRDPEHFRICAGLAAELGFDGIDVNLGCPDRNVLKQGAGAALIEEPELACAIVHATREGAQGLPVSVKTRVGFDRPEIERWIPQLLDTEPTALTLHGRTKRQGYLGQADWGLIARAGELVHKSGSTTLLIGNGDVSSVEQGRRLAAESGVPGVMIGRAAIGAPWIFSGLKPDLPTRLRVLREHAHLYEKYHGEGAGFITLRKHFARYASGFRGAKELRSALVRTSSLREVEQVLEACTSTAEVPLDELAT